MWQHLPFQYTTEDGHVAKFVFESGWPEIDAEHLSFPEEEVDFWGKILELRTEVNKALEVARSGKLIGSSLEAKVYLHCSNESLAERLNKMCEPSNEADALHHIFITSQVEILNSLQDERIKDVQYTGEYLIEEGNKIWIGVSRANGSKCDRCWNYSPQVGSFTEHPLLCGRCHNVVIGLQTRDLDVLSKVTQSEAKEAIAQ